ncbi:MAG: hypothetical protein Q8N23_21055 [Archangium sp.]|nr:hypothetical protein [Archangium sp.]MDP3155182.1 hypothetical protein [Archangium sp.]MDP3570872.1 hypothetical protein [Archangium sp.]
MCSFLTVGIEAKSASALEAALIALRLEVGREVNPHVARLFMPGDVVFMVTHGACSCDLVPLKGDSPREEKRRRRGMSGSRKPNQLSDSLFAALRAHRPVRLYFHEVADDQLVKPVPTGAAVTVVE